MNWSDLVGILEKAWWRMQDSLLEEKSMHTEELCIKPMVSELGKPEKIGLVAFPVVSLFDTF